ncbi:MAG TPA: vWA domain-containing protein [Burkholderiaceae bacterium]|nr:vWA domain-containing protein [Burkholderiaceae bacterium]
MAKGGVRRRRGASWGFAVALIVGGFLFYQSGRESSQPAATNPSVSAPQAIKSKWPFAQSSGETPAAPREFDPANIIKRNYYFVFDASGSMKDRKCSGHERKIEVAKRALIAFAGKVPADANLGLSVFDERGIRQLLALGPIDQATLAGAVAQIRAGGGTPLGEAIRLGYRALTQQAAGQLGYGEYHLVVVTDGEATGEDPRIAVDQLIADSPVVLHTIGFCIGDDHSLNQPGRTVYRAADNPEALAQGLSDVLAEAPSFDVARFK